jgi:hypothetical protein
LNRVFLVLYTAVFCFHYYLKDGLKSACMYLSFGKKGMTRCGKNGIIRMGKGKRKKKKRFFLFCIAESKLVGTLRAGARAAPAGDLRHPRSREKHCRRKPQLGRLGGHVGVAGAAVVGVVPQGGAAERGESSFFFFFSVAEVEEKEKKGVSFFLGFSAKKKNDLDSASKNEIF